MADNINKVSVRIHGQEYTISGTKSREYIIKVADHVDRIMREISAGIGGGPLSQLAVLSAVNITDDYFTYMDSQKSRDQEKAELENNIERYKQLWEEAKQNFLNYKEDAKVTNEQKEGLQIKLNAKSIEYDNLLKAAAAKDEKIVALETKIEDLSKRIQYREDEELNSSEAFKDLEDKYKEIEGSYFELQMENIKVKGELERYKKIVD
ncbi:MAG: cell division protein ZapA [Clostridiales Family XIII bacterium]|jgi:cell division protein ZapA|nr:cell division protein ZapA [Clostridiales Family XIII bacterium]